MNTDWNEAVTYAREQLDEAFEEIKNIEGIMSRHDMDVSEAFIRLNKLSKSDQSWIPDARALGDLTAESLTRAANRGLSLPDSPNDGAGPYLSHLRTVLTEAMRDPVAFDAARHHAKRLMSDNIPLCYELKRFACSVLGDEIIRPAGRKPKLHEARDAVFHVLICDLADRFDVDPTKNRASDNIISACDILAAAMPNKGGLPKSAGSLQRIWLEGERAWEREQLSEDLELP